MRRHRQLCTLLTILTGVLFLFIGSIDATIPPDTIVIGMRTDNAVSLDPAVAYEQASSLLVNQLYDKLVDFQGNDLTTPVPELAESWNVAEDGKTWTFHLRQGVRFSSGNPVNADAVIFSLLRVIRMQQAPSWLLTQFGIREEGIRKIDEHTVQIVLDQQYAPGLFLSCLAYTVGAILDPAIVLDHEQEGDLGTAWLHDHAAGSGPYRLERWDRNEAFILNANAHYWKGTPPIRQIIVKDVAEATNQMLMLDKGDLDMAWNLLPENVQKLQTNPAINIYETPSLFIRYIGMNMGYEPFRKLEVRDAIRYAIDYDGIIQGILQGNALQTQTILPKGLLGYNPAMPYSLNIEKSRQLMEAAGYPEGFDVELLCAKYTPLLDIAAKIQSDLAQIGIRVSIQSLVGAQVIQRIHARQFQMVLGSWGSDYVDPDANAKPFAHSDSLDDDATIKQTAWEHRYVNVETSRLVEEGAQELDPVKRAAIYEKISEIILHDGPYAILYSSIAQYGVRASIRNFIASPTFFLFDFSKLQKE